jgi:phage terminase small subunit
MKEKHKAFADYYIETLNAYDAAIKAGYSENYAKASSYKLLENDGIKTYIKERLDSKDNARIASQDEVLERLTAIMRGEVTDQLGLETPVKDMVKAAELLGRRYKLFVDKVEHDGAVPVKIIDDI